MEPHTGLNNLDYIVLGIIALSAIFALFRGFLREIVSLIAWSCAYIAAVKYHHLAEPFVHHYIKNESVITPIAVVGMFLTVLIVISIIGGVIIKFLKGTGLSAIDRSLGFIFGIFRGALVVSIVYMSVVSTLYPELEKAPQDKNIQEQEDKSPNHPPPWLIEAKTRPALAYGAKVLKAFIPKEDLEKSTKSAQEYIEKEYARQKNSAQKAMEQKELDMMSTPTPAPAKDASKPTYDDKSRSSLDQLIDQKGKP